MYNKYALISELQIASISLGLWLNEYPEYLLIINLVIRNFTYTRVSIYIFVCIEKEIHEIE